MTLSKLAEFPLLERLRATAIVETYTGGNQLIESKTFEEISKMMHEYERLLARHDALVVENERLKLIYAAAVDFIQKSPCDPDITDEQAQAWIKYQALISESASTGEANG